MIGVIGTVFACFGIYVITAMFYQEDGSFSAAHFEMADWIAVAFLSIWTLWAAWAAYTMLYSRLRYRIVIDKNGVREAGVPFRKEQKQFRWSEIQDYGYFFRGNYNFNGDRGGMYTLYFSPVRLQNKGAYRKKPVKDMISLEISDQELQQVAEEIVFPYCRNYRSFQPQTVEIKNHLL